MPKIVEYRGAEGLVFAEIIADDNQTPTEQDANHGYKTGTVKELAGLATVNKSTNSTDETHYYDNIPAIVISSEGSDTVTLNVSAIPLDVLAEITGQFYDAATGMLVEQERDPKYYALGYKTQNTDGEDILVWRLKGRFSIPDMESSTKNDGTDANGQELVYTGINTTHKFTKTGKSAKGVTVNDGLGLADTDEFFDTVQTPDTITAKA